MSLIVVDDRTQCALSLLSVTVSRARGMLFRRHGSSHNNKLHQINYHSTGLLLYQKEKRKNFHQKPMGSSRPNNFGELPFARIFRQVLSTRIPVSPEYQ